MGLDLKKLVPNIIENANLWHDLLDTATEELLNLQTQMEIKKRYLNPFLYTEEANLLNLSRSLGYSPNLSLRDDLDYIQEEVASIVFKIKNKSTYNYYNYLFKLIPKTGNIYIIYKDYAKLLRVADIYKTITYLDTHDFTQPFEYFLPIEHFDQYRDNEIELDASPLFYLDSPVAWYLDQDLVIKPTKHLSLEYQINELFQKNGENYLLTKDYFAYLRKGANYGRRVVDIPHIGANLSIILDNSGVYDNQNPGGSYSVPDLELRSTTTPLYDKETFNPKYIKFGNGQKSLYNQAMIGLVNDLLLYHEFENKNTTTMQDESPNNNDAEINGSFVLVEGASGKGISFNGINTEGIISSFTHSSTNDKTIAFWIKPDRFGQLYTTPYMIYQADGFWFYYDLLLEELIFGVDGDITSEVASAEIIQEEEFDNKFIFVYGEIDNSNQQLKLYINNVIQDSVDLSIAGFVGGNDNLYIGSNNGNNYYRGMMDGLRVYNKILTPIERNYLFTQKPGSLKELSDLVYTSELSTNQYTSINEWNYAESIYPANSVNKEIIGVGDGITSNFSGVLNFNNIQPNTFETSYFSFPSVYTIIDDGNGKLKGDAASGTINYETGEYSITTKLLKKVSQEILIEDTPQNTMEVYTQNLNIYPETLTINYWVNDVNFSTTDDGNGEFNGTGISSGTINYTTGYINIVFTDETDSLKNIYCSYDYVADSTPDVDINMEVKYKLKELLEITEAGVFDNDDNMIIYSTFPPTEFENIYNHLGVQFFVRNDY